MSRVVKVALIQQTVGLNSEENFRRSLGAVTEAAVGGAKLVVLQELHRSRYFCQQQDVNGFDLAETIPGPSTRALAELAAEHEVVIVSSLFEKRTAGLYHNTAVVLDSDGTIAGRYRKMHIPDDPGFYEKFYFSPGDLGFEPIQTRLGKLGVLVCWDQWFPEAARLMTLAGAELLIYPTAIGWDPTDDVAEKKRQIDAWIISQRAHAVANGLPVLSCNRVGFEPDPGPNGDNSRAGAGIGFWGNSFVAGPQGELLAQASTEDEHILFADVDLGRSETVRRIWPYLRDRRVDSYADLQKLFRD
ncbi:carbon-nitrogen hydrolase [Spongiibacter taiwanensis]|uniref:carbon-nitrogen hydrolase n=1 Tax=Spongiibacter taiwanensis TaxID=1748242 RepID=UPI0020350F6D|nr:carbon-nitrogen hydrolase [Spongiibacter taiwanensis]USA42689.1 carbon-nitrogen hydrolase [Spongiibacter taiwanensis]